MRYRKIPNLGTDYIQILERVHTLERIVQAIGFSPDFPYTLSVNDGTRNRVYIGKIGSDYGIKIVNNAGVEIVFADGHISASGITTGTLDASIVTVTNLNASNIVTGTLSATKISGGTLDCSLMTVSNLSAGSITTGSMSGSRITARTLSADRLVTNSITADELSTGELITQSAQIKNAVITNAHINDLNAGKINAGTINADRIAVASITATKLSISTLSAISADLGTITAGTITGATIRTASSGQRVVIDTSNTIKFYDSGGIQRGSIYAGVGLLEIDAWQAGDDILLIPGSGGDVEIGGNALNILTSNGVTMNGHEMSEIGYLKFNTMADSSTSGRMWYHDGGGGSYYFHARMGSWNGQFDQSSF